MELAATVENTDVVSGLSRLIASLLWGVLAGCAVGPAWHAPLAPAHAGYAPEPLANAEGQQLVAGRDIPAQWWVLFHSSILNALIEEALTANPTLAAARAALAQAQEMVYVQQGLFFPAVGAVGQAERHKVSGNTNSSQTIGVQGNGTNLLPQVESVTAAPHNKPSYYTFYTAELAVSFVPDVFGGNRRAVESLAAQAEAQRFALEAAYLTLASNLVAAVIQEASVRSQIRVTHHIIAADEKALWILRDQFRLGYATRIDVAAQEAALSQVLSTLPALEKQLEETRDLMRVLVGKLPTYEIDAFELEALQLPPELPLSMPGQIVEQRPDVRAAQAQIHSANAQVGVAIAAMLPQFLITGQYGGNATKITQMFSSGGPFWSLFGNLTQPIFQGGTLLHQKRAASAGLRQAAAEYQNAVLTAYQNVGDTLRATLADAKTLAADVEAETAAKIAYELSLRQMRAGFITPLAFLKAQTIYHQAQLIRVQIQAARLGDSVALFQALGGGWWNRPELAAR